MSATIVRLTRAFVRDELCAAAATAAAAATTTTTFTLRSFCVDLYLRKDGTLRVVDVAALSEATDAILFEWSELAARAKRIDDGGDAIGDDEVLRLVTNLNNVIRPNLNGMPRLPKELLEMHQQMKSSGTSAHEGTPKAMGLHSGGGESDVENVNEKEEEEEEEEEEEDSNRVDSVPAEVLKMLGMQ
jgi:hypothetical protein